MKEFCVDSSKIFEFHGRVGGHYSVWPAIDLVIFAIDSQNFLQSFEGAQQIG
ncbi:hypothetical protein [Bartonella australis]|uniref:hypothetical protein n=1 Tax=Bartonella australis TaxID=388640 RepID=UPI0003493C30|nr:hypothetical protein [Bartonella australis]